MTEVIAMPASARELSGKGPARATRRAGLVPGVIYGARKDPALISIEERELIRQLQSSAFFNTLFDVKVGGSTERVLPRDVQFHPVNDKPIHVDFLRVSQTTVVTVAVPVSFINEERCPGLRRGGVLNVVRHEIEFHCRADAIPHEIEIDLDGIDVGEGVHISMVTLPPGVTPTITDRDFTIATIAAPTVFKEPAEEEEAEEGEEAETEEGEAAEETEGGEEAKE